MSPSIPRDRDRDPAGGGDGAPARARSLASHGRPVREARLGEFVAGRTRPMMAMVEVTNRCNMDCPVCFSDANHPARDVPFDEIRRRLERLLAVTGTPIPIQLSGGEPTLRDDLEEVVGLARSLGYRNVELITNGIRASREADLLPRLRARGLTAVYLQFDGLRPATTTAIRGRDMSEVRERAVAAARRAGLCCTLAVAVARGVNDDELGDVVRFGVANIDTVRAINFQSATRFTGRFDLAAADRGYALPELLALLERQTGLPADTFRSEHLGHPLCNAMSLVFVVDGRLEPLFKYVSREEMLRFLGDDRREKVLGLFAGKREFFTRFLCNPRAWKLIAQAAPIFGASPLNVLRAQHILLFAKSFMERDALDPARVASCCYGITDQEGVYSFCAFNNLYRFPDRTRSESRAP
ncbi:MAG TPA: radical SAM protein [Candidatus Binatia bacterium]|nr:radical SAM protein [Candidatus Binatia bacterium]